MKKVRAKKHLGQHFLTDLTIAQKTVDVFARDNKFSQCIEVGPGMGVLTQFLIKREDLKTTLIDLDKESVDYLIEELKLECPTIYGDFLELNLSELFNNDTFGVIGNFPYNISTQILFKVLDNKDIALEVVGMFQKEVGERICAKPGSKIYGITSILLQAFYDTDYLFTIDEHVFNPPPKVKSCIIQLKRNNVKKLPCDEKKFKQIVKMAFNQRRKTLRNSLKSILNDSIRSKEIFNKRPEQLSVQEFIELTLLLS